MFKFSQTPLAFDEVFVQCFQLYKESFRSILNFIIVLAVVSSVPTFLHNIMQGLPQIVYLILMLFAWGFFSVAIIKTLNNYGTEDQSDPMALAKSKYLPTVGLIVLVTIPVFLGYLLFFIPGVFLNVLLFFAIPALVISNKSIIGAFKFSCQLVWGKWWRTFGILFIAYVVPLVILGLVSDFGVTSSGIAFTGGILQILVNVLFLPWYFCLMTLLFHDLNLSHAPPLQETNPSADKELDSDD